MSEAIDMGEAAPAEGAPSGGGEASIESAPAAQEAPAAGESGGGLLEALGGDAPAQEPAQAAQSLPGWMEGWSTEDVAYAQNKGWHKEGKGPADILKAYRMAESKIGGDPSKDIRLPGDWDDPQQLSQWRESIGAPSDPSGYGELDIKTVRGPLEAEPIAKMAAELALMPWQYEKLAHLAAAMVDETATQQDATTAARNRAEEAEWRTENEVSAADAVKIVTAARAAAGLDGEDTRTMLATLGAKKTMNILKELAGKMREHEVTDGDGRTGFEGGMSQEVAKERLKQRMRDKDFFAKLEANNPEAVKEWQSLQAASATRD